MMIIFILFLLLIACMLTVMYSALIVASDYDDLVEEVENEKSNKDIDCAEPADDNVHADNGV